MKVAIVTGGGRGIGAGTVLINSTRKSGMLFKNCIEIEKSFQEKVPK